MSESTETIDRIVKLDENEAIEGVDYIVIAAPTRVEVGFWYKCPDGAWHSETFRQTDAVISTPKLNATLNIGSLYERVFLSPRQGPPLVLDEPCQRPV